MARNFPTLVKKMLELHSHTWIKIQQPILLVLSEKKISSSRAHHKKTRHTTSTKMKQQTIPKDSLPQDVQQNCTEFSSSLSTIEQLLKPLANGEFNNKELAPIERAKLNLCCAYTVNTLLYSMFHSSWRAFFSISPFFWERSFFTRCIC